MRVESRYSSLNYPGIINTSSHISAKRVMLSYVFEVHVFNMDKISELFSGLLLG